MNTKIVIIIGLIVWAFSSLILYKIAESYGWFSWATIFSIVPYLILDRIGIFETYFQSRKMKLNVLRFIVFVPVLSFSAGKYNSELIQKNKEYKYIVSKGIKINGNVQFADTLKLIGNSNQQYFFTDLKNSFILILRSDKIDTLVLKQHG